MQTFNLNTYLFRFLSLFILVNFLGGCSEGSNNNQPTESISERPSINLDAKVLQGKDFILNDVMALIPAYNYDFQIVSGPLNGKLVGDNLFNLTYTSNIEFSGQEKIVLDVNFSSGSKFTYSIILDVIPMTKIISGGTLNKVINPASKTPALLVRHFQVTTSNPSSIIMTITDNNLNEETLTFDSLQKEHSYLIWVFNENSSYDVSITFIDQYGLTSDPIALERVITEPLPNDMFQIDFQKNSDKKLEPGITMLLASEKGPNAHTYSIAVRNNGSIVGVFKDEFYGYTLDDEMLFFQPPSSFIEFDAINNEINETFISDTSISMHHDLKKLPNGNYLSLDRKDRTITNFPINFFDSNVIEDAEVIDDIVIEIDPSGRIINEWSMMDLLDPRRIGFLSLKKIAGSYDWGHANSISYDSEQNSILVSLRAQDAVVSFDKALGTLNWILGNHDNWDESIREYLLNPVGEVEWPFGQHDIQPLGNNTYSLFDNGNYRATPFNSESLEVPDEKTFSRSVIYQIDPLTKTISTVAEYRPDPVLFSRAVGSTQLLPGSGNILSNFGVLTEIPDSNIKSAKIIETNGTQLSEVLSTISVSNSSSNWGVRVYRAWKLPIDYQATATVLSTPKVEIY